MKSQAHAYCNMIEAEIHNRVGAEDEYREIMEAVSSKLWERFHGDSGGDWFYQWPAIKKAFDDIGADDPEFIRKFRDALIKG